MTAIPANPILRTLHENRGMLFPLACIALLVVLLVPLPPGVLDLLLVLNLTLSVLILVTTIYVKSALQSAAFPSLLADFVPDPRMEPADGLRRLST